MGIPAEPENLVLLIIILGIDCRGVFSPSPCLTGGGLYSFVFPKIKAHATPALEAHGVLPSSQPLASTNDSFAPPYSPLS